jgi:hypothetical protein
VLFKFVHELDFGCLMNLIQPRLVKRLNSIGFLNPFPKGRLLFLFLDFLAYRRLGAALVFGFLENLKRRCGNLDFEQMLIVLVLGHFATEE